MSKAVAICGHICSGKSTITSYLADSYGWNVISFGNYIKYLANLECVTPSRESYQSFGQRVYTERGPRHLLQDVIAFNQPLSPVHLFDGVRHTPIVEALRHLYEDTMIIYLAISDHQRYSRFRARVKLGDSLLTYQEFLTLSRQPVEEGISDIAGSADYHLSTEAGLSYTIKTLENELARRNFIIRVVPN